MKSRPLIIENLPPSQKKWVIESLYIADFTRTVRAMFSPLPGGVGSVMSHGFQRPRDAFIGQNMYPTQTHLGWGYDRFVTAGLSQVRDIRKERKAYTERTVSVMARRATEAAASAASKAMGKTTSKATPTIMCPVNEPPRVIGDDAGGTAHVSVNWINSVEKNGIAVLEWGANNLVLTCSAKHNPSVFLAEMGVTCYEVLGMRLGQKAYEVRGYAFTAVLEGKRHSIFSEDFRRGVTTMQNLIADAFSAAMKVQ